METTRNVVIRASKGIRTWVVGLALALALWGAGIPRGIAEDLTGPAQVMGDYLASLVNGDTQQLIALIDGPMKEKNSHLILNPDTYSQFLKKNYVGVQTIVERLTGNGDQVRVRVRFDYPSSESSAIEFILTEVEGQWKITDEIY